LPGFGNAKTAAVLYANIYFWSPQPETLRNLHKRVADVVFVAFHIGFGLEKE